MYRSNSAIMAKGSRDLPSELWGPWTRTSLPKAACTCRALSKMLPQKMDFTIEAFNQFQWALWRWGNAEMVKLVLWPSDPEQAWVQKLSAIAKGMSASREAQSITLALCGVLPEPSIDGLFGILMQCSRLRFVNLYKMSGQLTVPPLLFLHHLIDTSEETLCDAQLHSITQMQNLRTLRLARNTAPDNSLKPHACFDATHMPCLVRVILVYVQFVAISLPPSCDLHVSGIAWWQSDSFQAWGRVVGQCRVAALQFDVIGMQYQWLENLLCAKSCTSLHFRGSIVGNSGTPVSFLGPIFARIKGTVLRFHEPPCHHSKPSGIAQAQCVVQKVRSVI